ncbi:ATP-grasp domain-containing protein [Kitasatospora purpeofusca]|uniref:ATP-binding protein n=1 Tax=Kitasatospora purpeofusca TaxID=67352 RepID=UPI002253F4D3|nr:ATP-grasp domain-containing protein [Kitasatospora purpeofusca]MCX4758716.1 ATP-grasp domain-containing protein [Kitasatospora purpeofusca]WSR30850.1 ATP-grasp domain-containing protein [Kitasatospora purpeofusca]
MTPAPSPPAFGRTPLTSTIPTLLLVSAGDEQYRRYALEQIAARHRVVLLSPSEPTWEAPYIHGHEVADTSDPDASLAAAERLAADHHIKGVLTWDEFAQHTAAHLACRFATSGNSTATAHTCRDKAASRAAFAAFNVPSAASVRADTPDQARAAAATIGYPVVLKPAAAAGSIGVSLAATPKDLTAAFDLADQAAGDHEHATGRCGVLVEEYLDGPEISVECVTVRGATTPVAVTRKRLGPPPYFEETGHSVEAGDPLLALVGPVAVRALHAVGYANGVSHVEMRLTASGPRLIEVNGRLAGDLIPHLVREATGIDLPLAAADIAVGLRPDLTPTRRRAAAIHMAYAPADGRLTRATADPALRHQHWLERLVWEKQPGDHVALPPAGNLGTARVAHLVATAATAEICLQHLADAARQLDITTD